VAGILGSLDEKIENNRRLIRTTEALARTLFKKHIVSNEESEGWENGKISDLVNIYSGYAFKRTDFDDDGKYGLVTIKNVQDGNFVQECTDHLATLPKNMPDYIHLKTGDILLSLTGNVGRTCLVVGDDLLLNQRVAKLEGKNGNAFVYFLMRSDEMRNLMQEMAHGTAQLNLSPVELKNKELKLPPAAVLQTFNAAVEPLFVEIGFLTRENQTLAALRDKLLRRLIK